MPRTGRLNDPMILEAALEGLKLQRQRIDEHIAEVQALLGKGRPGRPTKAAAAAKPAKKKRTFSAAARKRMAEGAKSRWAAQKKAQGSSAKKS